jgi:hypothetical protein
MGKVFCVLSLFIFFLCENKNEQRDNFEKFIASFEQKKLPLKFDSFFLESKHSNKELDTSLARTFIESDGKHYVFKVYDFYPVCRLSLNDDLMALIYKKEGGAGGFQDNYFLATFNFKGEKKASQLIAKKEGDCGFLRYRLALIKENFNIKINERSYKGSCSDKEGKLTKNKKKWFFITDKGEILKKQ